MSYPTAADRRWWHRRWLPLGRHRPDLPLVALGMPVLSQCRCGWVGVQLGEYAQFLGAPMTDSPLAEEWVWLPWQVWQQALKAHW